MDALRTDVLLDPVLDDHQVVRIECEQCRRTRQLPQRHGRRTDHGDGTAGTSARVGDERRRRTFRGQHLRDGRADPQPSFADGQQHGSCAGRRSTIVPTAAAAVHQFGVGRDVSIASRVHDSAVSATSDEVEKETSIDDGDGAVVIGGGGHDQSRGRSVPAASVSEHRTDPGERSQSPDGQSSAGLVPQGQARPHRGVSLQFGSELTSDAVASLAVASDESHLHHIQIQRWHCTERAPSVR